MRDQSALQKGIEYLKAGRPDEAIAELERACSQMPDDFRAFNFLGVAYAQKKLYDRAIGVFLKASQLKPDVASIHYNLGLAYEADGFHDRAKEQFERALQIDPGYERAKEALKQAEKALEAEGTNEVCARHPEEDAVGHCVLCLLPVCRECKTVVNNQIYCKQCASKLQVGR